MNAREVIAEAIRYGGRATAINKALFVIAGLRARGFVILPKSEVEAMVEKAFRDGLRYGTICKVTDVDEAWRTSSAYASIRNLKSGGE